MARHRTLLLATGNPGKLSEFRRILGDLPVELICPADLNLELAVPEEGQTFAENARAKACAYAAAAGMPALADDSGLEVDALGGRPGVMSARYGGEGASDSDRRRLLLAEMEAVPDGQRSARFRCVIAVCWGGQVYLTEGSVEGTIAREERGSGGFGYDRLFLLPDRGRTMAELSPEEKNALSHRGQAARAMRAVLERLLQGNCSAPGLSLTDDLTKQ
ncbi:MAG: RdgB/HAM1 family non-canonical purine NTP pyrophosphatase [Anaerolineae bacterium]|nr:RdgB/HAM1 family non-canonical purine NTP pyrophosphatase [Anaerolineae bacterium]